MTREETAIRQTLENIRNAWNLGDGMGYAAHFSEDADFTIINGIRIKGRETIGRQHQQIFDTFYKGSILRIEIEQLRFLDKRIVAVHTLGTVVLKGQPDHFPTARQLYILAKQDENWQIEVFQNTPLANDVAEQLRTKA